MLNSDYRPICDVTLPYAARQHYMHEFDLSSPSVPKGFEDYLVPVVKLCKAAGAKTGIAYLTVDEKIVLKGKSQRRPKPHVDGVFLPDRGMWGGGGGGWLHYCNNIGVGPLRRMPVIVAASVPGCRAWKGEFDATAKEDGDLSHLPLGKGEVLKANVGYLLSPDCVHESMLQDEAVARSFLRIALPIDFKF